MSRQLGFVSVALVKEYGKEPIYQKVIRFQFLETAAAWRESKDHTDLPPRLKSLYIDSSLQVYDVVASQ